jgi:hypothetical protein
MRRLLAIAACLASFAAADSFAASNSATPESLRAATQQLLRDWAEAQHRGDAATYLGFYDARHFKGQKRVTSGERKQYDYAAWAKDRTRMLANKPEVAVEALRIETWRDARSKLRPGLLRVHFLQRWRSPRYADHGPKIMQLFQSPDGKLHIIYEALLQSLPGWDRPAGAARELTLPKNDAEALAAWQALGIRGSNWEQVLATLPDAPHLRRVMARALIAAGGYECTDIVDEGECGMSDPQWAPLHDDAGIEDPCVRRNVVAWALANGKLTASDLRPLWPRLEAVFAMDTPGKRAGDDDKHDTSDLLCRAVLDASAAAEELAVAAIDAAVAQRCSDEAALQMVPSLSPKGALRLAELGHVEAAFAGIDARAHFKLFLDAVGNKALSDDFRSDTMSQLAALGHKAELSAALAAVESDPKSSDALSEAAAVVLAGLGDKQYLAARGTISDESELAHQLRRLQFDPDEKRREKLFRAFLPARGRFVVRDTDTYEYDGNTPVEERNEDQVETQRLRVGEVKLSVLARFFKPEPEERVTLVWKNIDGTAYLVGIETVRTHFIGCPC